MQNFNNHLSAYRRRNLNLAQMIAQNSLDVHKTFKGSEFYFGIKHEFGDQYKPDFKEIENILDDIEPQGDLFDSSISKNVWSLMVDINNPLTEGGALGLDSIDLTLLGDIAVQIDKIQFNDILLTQLLSHSKDSTQSIKFTDLLVKSIDKITQFEQDNAPHNSRIENPYRLKNVHRAGLNNEWQFIYSFIGDIKGLIRQMAIQSIDPKWLLNDSYIPSTPNYFMKSLTMKENLKKILVGTLMEVISLQILQQASSIGFAYLSSIEPTDLSYKQARDNDGLGIDADMIHYYFKSFGHSTEKPKKFIYLNPLEFQEMMMPLIIFHTFVERIEPVVKKLSKWQPFKKYDNLFFQNPIKLFTQNEIFGNQLTSVDGYDFRNNKKKRIRHFFKLFRGTKNISFNDYLGMQVDYLRNKMDATYSQLNFDISAMEFQLEKLNQIYFSTEGVVFDIISYIMGIASYKHVQMKLNTLMKQYLMQKYPEHHRESWEEIESILWEEEFENDILL